jgi:hypothetical protein
MTNSTLKRRFEINSLITSEYSWNTEAPGWGWYPEDAKNITRIEEKVPQINEELLPRALSIFFGEEAAPYIAKALSTCISANIAVNQSAFKGAKFLPYFKSKTKAGVYAVENMQKASSLVTGNERKEFDYWFLLIKAAAKLNKVKYLQLSAREDLANSKIEKAEKTIAEAKRILKSIEVSERYRRYWINTLMKDLDVAKNIGWYKAKKKYLADIDERKINVGVYNYGWHKGIVYSLNNSAGMQTGVFEDPQPQYLNEFDAVIFNACKNTGDVYGDWRKSVRDFAKNGGVVIFTHNAIGRHPSSDFGKQIFPEICSGYNGQQVNERTLTIKKNIDGKLKSGSNYVHGYFDHLMPKPGKNADIIMVNKFDKPVMIGGKIGKGYVIYTGEIFGINDKGNDSDLVDDNWKMLFHTIRHAEKQITK